MKQITQEAYNKLLIKKKELEEKRVGIAERIESAKELGDLSENIEYTTARQDMNMILDEIDRLGEILRDCEVVSVPRNKSCIHLGSVVNLEFNGKKQTYTIVSFNEFDPSVGKISNESPLGNALINRCVGDEFKFQTPSGNTISCKIIKID